MKRRFFFSFLVTYYFMIVNGHSEHLARNVSDDIEFFDYTLSTETDGYYYAIANDIDHKVTQWIVKRINSASKEFISLCQVIDVDERVSVSKKSLKTWGYHKILLMDLYNGTLKIYNNKMPNYKCSQTNYSITNVNEFQVYATNEDEFDVFYTTSDPDNEYVMRNTYNDSGLKSTQKTFLHRSETWEALLLGNTSYYFEKRLENDGLHQVVSQVQSNNMTDLMELGHMGYERFLTSNQHGELGACYLFFESYFICRRYGNTIVSKFNFSLDYNNLKHPTDDGSKTRFFLNNLENGSSLIIFVNEYSNKTTEDRVIRSFRPLVIHPDGQRSNASIEVEFENSDLPCYKKLNNVTYQTSPKINVLEREEELCFQFLCSYDLPEVEQDPSIQYSVKCLSKEIFGFKIAPKPKPNGVETAFNTSFVFISLIALILIKF